MDVTIRREATTVALDLLRRAREDDRTYGLQVEAAAPASLHLSVCSTSRWWRVTVPAEPMAAGRAVVHQKVFRDVVRACPAEQVDLRVGRAEEGLRFSSAGYAGRVWVRGDDQPSWGGAVPPPDLELAAADLLALLDRGGFAAPGATSNLRAVLLEREEDVLWAASTDSHRMAWARLPSPGPPMRLLLDPESADACRALVKAGAERLSLAGVPDDEGKPSRGVAVRAEAKDLSAVLVTRLQYLEFPATWRRVLQEKGARVRVASGALGAALAQLRAAGGGAVSIEPGEGELRLAARAANYRDLADEGRAIVPADVPPGAAATSLQLPYVQQFLEVCGEALTLACGGAEAPAYFAAEGRDDHGYVVMPIRA